MKKEKNIFWASTGIFSALMLFSSYAYITSDAMKVAFNHLGFSNYFRVELAVAKFLGVLTLLLPIVPKSVKVFAYHGFLITVFSAIIAHTSSGDPAFAIITPVVIFAILVTSYIYFHRLKRYEVNQK